MKKGFIIILGVILLMGSFAFFYFLKEMNTLTDFLINVILALVIILSICVVIFIMAKNKNNEKLIKITEGILIFGLFLIIGLIMNIILINYNKQENNNNGGVIGVLNEEIKIKNYWSSNIINFADKNFELYLVDKINYGLAMHYSSDELNVGTKEGIIINQYGNEISSKNLAVGIVDQTEQIENQELIQKFTTPDSKNRNAYYVITRSIDNYEQVYDYPARSTANVSIIKIFEDNNSTYSIVFNITLEASNENEIKNISDQWIIDNLESYGKSIDNIDISKNVEFYNKNKLLGESINKANKYKSLKWETQTIKEKSDYSDVEIKYPKFIGGDEIVGLNKLVKDIVDLRLQSSKDLMKDVPSDSECNNPKDHSYECDISLNISYEIEPLFNDIVGVKIIVADYTGGGNGNHSQISVINYDLKNKKEIRANNLFCSPDYIKKLIPILQSEIYSLTGIKNEESEIENATGLPEKNLTDKDVLFGTEYTQNILITKLGLVIYFQPYSVASGSAGIVGVFIPYSEIENLVCMP